MGDIDISVDVDLKQKNKNMGKQIADDIAEGVRDTLMRFGIINDGKNGEKKGGLSGAAVMGAIAGGVMKLVDFVGGIVADWPPIVAALKLLKAIIMILLMPLVPILRPILMLLALVAKGLLAILGPKNRSQTPILDALNTKSPTKVIDAVNNPLGVPGLSIGDWVKSITDGIASIDWKAVGNALKEAFTQLGNYIKNLWNTYIVSGWETLKMAGQKIWNDFIVPGFRNFKSFAFQIWGDYIQPAFTWFQGLGQRIWDQYLSPAWNFFVGIGQKIWDTILNPAFSWLSDVGTKIWNIIKDPFQQLASKLADIFKWIKSVVRSLIGGGSVNDGIVQNGKIITTHPDDYIVATKDPSSLGGKGGITININNPVVRDDRDIDALVKKISMELQKSYRGRVSYV